MDWRRAHSLLGFAVALALMTLGAAAANRPLRLHGPMGLDATAPLGVLALVLGMLMLRGLASGPAVFRLAALLVLAAAGYNFYGYPPIPDGAYFLVRYGHAAGGELWPASAAWHVIAFAGLAWSLALGIAGDAPAGRGPLAAEAGLTLLLTAIGAAVFEMFSAALPRVGGPWPQAGWYLGVTIAIAIAALVGRRFRRRPAAGGLRRRTGAARSRQPGALSARLSTAGWQLCVANIIC